MDGVAAQEQKLCFPTGTVTSIEACCRAKTDFRAGPPGRAATPQTIAMSAPEDDLTEIMAETQRDAAPASAEGRPE